MAKLLLDLAADREAKDKSGNTPFRGVEDEIALVFLQYMEVAYPKQLM